MTKPDRFERVVKDVIYPGDAARLLRREHAATVRAVKKLCRDKLGPPGCYSLYQNGYQAACADILAMLERGKQ